MNVQYATFTSKGQLVIPAPLRRKLGIKAGTRVAVRENHGQIILQPMTEAYIDATQGMLGDTSLMIEYIRRERHREK